MSSKLAEQTARSPARSRAMDHRAVGGGHRPRLRVAAVWAAQEKQLCQDILRGRAQANHATGICLIVGRRVRYFFPSSSSSSRFRSSAKGLGSPTKGSPKHPLRIGSSTRLYMWPTLSLKEQYQQQRSCYRFKNSSFKIFQNLQHPKQIKQVFPQKNTY